MVAHMNRGDKMARHLVLVLIGLLVILSVHPVVLAEGFYFVALTNSSPDRPRHADQMNVYRYDSVQNTLEVESTNMIGDGWESIRNYSKLGKLIVASPYDSEPEITMLDFRSPKDVATYKIGDARSFMDFKLAMTEAGNLLIEATYPKRGESGRFHVVRTVGKNSMQTTTLSSEASRPVLAGMGSSYVGSSYDILIAHIDSQGIMRSDDEFYTFDLLPIPDGVIQTKNSEGWVVFVNDDHVMACASRAIPAPTTLGREVLLYDKAAGMWESYEFLGSETSPRSINNWLAGVVMNAHPDNDYERYMRFPSIKTDKAVLFNLQTRDYFVVELGDQCEVLWVDDSHTIFYRVDNQLMSARFSKSGLTDVITIATASYVRGIHWAYRGSAE